MVDPSARITRPRVTRGYGLLEGLLAQLRRRKARKLIGDRDPAESMLDIGCGHHPLLLLESNFETKIGIDQEASLANPADYKTQGVDLVPWDLSIGLRLPFQDSSFDVITMLAVLEHLEPRGATFLLREIRRLLRPAGIFVLTIPAWWTPWLLQALARLKILSAVEIGEHQAAYRPRQIAEVLAAAGFERDQIACGHFELGMNTWATARTAP